MCWWYGHVSSGGVAGVSVGPAETAPTVMTEYLQRDLRYDSTVFSFYLAHGNQNYLSF